MRALGGVLAVLPVALCRFDTEHAVEHTREIGACAAATDQQQGQDNEKNELLAAQSLLLGYRFDLDLVLVAVISGLIDHFTASPPLK